MTVNNHYKLRSAVNYSVNKKYFVDPEQPPRIAPKTIAPDVFEVTGPEGSLGHLNELEFMDLRTQIAESKQWAPDVNSPYSIIYQEAGAAPQLVPIKGDGDLIDWPRYLYSDSTDALTRHFRARQKHHNHFNQLISKP